MRARFLIQYDEKSDHWMGPEGWSSPKIVAFRLGATINALIQPETCITVEAEGEVPLLAPETPDEERSRKRSCSHSSYLTIGPSSSMVLWCKDCGAFRLDEHGDNWRTSHGFTTQEEGKAPVGESQSAEQGGTFLQCPKCGSPILVHGMRWTSLRCNECDGRFEKGDFRPP